MTGLMDVVVDGRATGKTTLLLDWLHAGHVIDSYPGWSRVVVCMHYDSVVPVTDQVKKRFGNGPWAKCIFSEADLRSAFRGAIWPGTVEYAIDDADVMVGRYLARYISAPEAPTLITINGTAAYR